MVPDCVAEDFPEQQPGEGKCPLTHYVLLLYNSPSHIMVSLYLPFPCLRFGLLWLASCYCFTLNQQT
jgi:hypothetical protein